MNHHSGSQEYKSVLPRYCLRFVIVVFPDQTHLLFPNKTTTHISESDYMLYMYHVVKNLRKEAVSDRFRIWAANK